MIFRAGVSRHCPFYSQNVLNLLQLFLLSQQQQRRSTAATFTHAVLTVYLTGWN